MSALPVRTDVLPFTAPWPKNPEDEPIIVIDGPDYSYAYLRWLVRSRRKKPVLPVPPDDVRCVAVAPGRNARRSPLPTKHRCRKRATCGPYCHKHKHLLFRVGA